MSILFFKEPKIFTQVVFFPLTSDGRVMLGKKQKKIGKGCWNGFGGNILINESPLAAVTREFEEEGRKARIIQSTLQKRAKLVIGKQRFISGGKIIILHAYVGGFEGTIEDSDEIKGAQPFDVKKLPKPLMPGDELWVPDILSGKSLLAQANFDPFFSKVLVSFKMQYVDSIPCN